MLKQFFSVAVFAILLRGDCFASEVSSSSEAKDIRFEFGPIDAATGLTLGIANPSQDYRRENTIETVVKLRNNYRSSTKVSVGSVGLTITDRMGKVVDYKRLPNELSNHNRFSGSFDPEREIVYVIRFLVPGPGAYNIIARIPIFNIDKTAKLTDLRSASVRVDVDAQH